MYPGLESEHHAILQPDVGGAIKCLEAGQTQQPQQEHPKA